MQEYIRRLKRRVIGFFVVAYRWCWRRAWVRPYIRSAEQEYARIHFYFQTHPKARLWARIIGYPLGIFLFFAIFVWIETPGGRELRNIQNQVASEVYSADSVLLGRFFVQDRTEIKYKDIAPAVIDALICTEDARFYQHTGIDYRSLGRVLFKSILQQDESSGGGSTLTQQLAKNLYPRKRYWIFPVLINKLREVRIARKLEDLYTKEELITLYLNTVPFADNVFGIQAAADRFYSKPASELKPDEAALLIGMLKATHSYNPRLFPDRALKRRNVVISQMAKYKRLDPAKAKKLMRLPVELEYNKVSHHQGLAPYFREYVKSELLEWCRNHEKEDGSPYNLYTDGLKIYTTIDSRMQEYAENAVTQQMREIQNTFFEHWGKQKPWKGKEDVLEQAIQRSSRYQQLRELGMTEEEIMKNLQKPVATSIFTWNGVKETKISPIDSIIHHLQYLNAGFLALEPSTGKIKAWVGGIDHDFFQFDHVKTSTKRQVGSIFKPIVYALAIEDGAEPCELVSAERKTYTEVEGKEWTPRNSQNDYDVEYSMKGALAYSVNTVAAKMIEVAGVPNTISFARKLGITSEIPEVPSIALGSSSISLMEMTTAYACFANNGMPTRTYFIQAIHDPDGNVFDDFKPSAPEGPAMSKETAQLMTSMLRTVVLEGTASRLRWKYGVYDDVAGKTGTTQQNADGWFMSITPHLAMGAWVGADDPRIRFRSTELGQGSNTALPITGYFLEQLDRDKKFKKMMAEKFPALPPALQEKLNCDLYELDYDLRTKIENLIYKRDSAIQADPLAPPPPVSFLQMLYERKIRIMKAALAADSIKRLQIDIIEGDDGDH